MTDKYDRLFEDLEDDLKGDPSISVARMDSLFLLVLIIIVGVSLWIN